MYQSIGRITEARMLNFGDTMIIDSLCNLAVAKVVLENGLKMQVSPVKYGLDK